MGWETNVITQITFNKETYDSIYKVEEELEFCNKRIKEIVNSIMMYSTSRPQDILLNREEATLETIQEDIEDKLELLEEYFVKRNLCYYICFPTHNIIFNEPKNLVNFLLYL